MQIIRKSDDISLQFTAGQAVNDNDISPRDPGREVQMDRIGCIVMASGRSLRFGTNKLLAKLGGKEIILHVTGSLRMAGLRPLAVTRSCEVKELLDKEGTACILHDRPLKSDTMHIGMRNLPADLEGWLFVPADQPLILPSSIRRMAEKLRSDPLRAVRLGYGGKAGSPVLFPAVMRDALMELHQDAGGSGIFRQGTRAWQIEEAEYEWELWDVDTPEDLQKAEKLWGFYSRLMERFAAE